MAAVRRAKDTKANFDLPARTSLDELAAQQGVKPLSDPKQLIGTFWPEDESLDEFLATLRAWRQDGGADPT